VIVFLAGRGGWWGSKSPATKGLDWMEEPPNHERSSWSTIWYASFVTKVSFFWPPPLAPVLASPVVALSVGNSVAVLVVWLFSCLPVAGSAIASLWHVLCQKALR